MNTRYHSQRGGLSLRSRNASDHTPSRSIRAAALKIVRGLQIDGFTSNDSGTGFRTFESGRLTWYAATAQNVRDVLWNRWRHRPRRSAAVHEAVRIIIDEARQAAA